MRVSCGFALIADCRQVLLVLGVYSELVIDWFDWFCVLQCCSVGYCVFFRAWVWCILCDFVCCVCVVSDFIVWLVVLMCGLGGCWARTCCVVCRLCCVVVWACRFGGYVVMGLLLLARVGLVYVLVVCWLLVFLVVWSY